MTIYNVRVKSSGEIIGTFNSLTNLINFLYEINFENSTIVLLLKEEETADYFLEVKNE